MKGSSSLLFALTLLFVVGLPGCGSNRQLQSISINPANINGTQATFTATAMFNASPMTVNPASVSWMAIGPGFDPAGPGYSLIAAPWTMPCIFPTGAYTIVAFAPANPNAPANGAMSAKAFQDLVINHTVRSEDGFVAATAQLTCP